MALDIPERDAGSLAEIKTLKSASMEKFIAALVAATPTSNPDEMAKQISKRVPSIPAELLTRFLRSLYTLYHIRELSGVSHPRFLEDLMDGLSGSRSLRLTQNDIVKLRSNLDRLMSIDSLNTIAKAARLQRDGERLYCTGKILSDIRSVFGKDPAARPLGAVLTHTLKVGYHEGSEHREFHVVLDSDDLEELSEVVQRAKVKDKTLRQLLRSIKLQGFDE